MFRDGIGTERGGAIRQGRGRGLSFLLTAPDAVASLGGGGRSQGQVEREVERVGIRVGVERRVDVVYFCVVLSRAFGFVNIFVVEVDLYHPHLTGGNVV